MRRSGAWSGRLATKTSRGGPLFPDSLAALLRLVLSPLRRQFYRLIAGMGFEGCPSAEGRVWPLGIVVSHPLANPGPGLGAGFEGLKVDALVFHGPPQALDEDVVYPASFAVHRHLHIG